MPTAKRHLTRYQLQWKPAFPFREGADRNRKNRVYVLGERLEFKGDSEAGAGQQFRPDDEANILRAEVSQDPNTFSAQQILTVAYNSTLILPFNSSVALAQAYNPGVKNKMVEYETLGGNTIHTFGMGIKKVGMNIVIIKAGRHWESYVKGLEAFQYLTGNQGRFFGSMYLIGWDQFNDGTQLLAGRYKVTIESLDFQHRSDKNTTVSADLMMKVLADYGNYQSNKTSIWGAL